MTQKIKHMNIFSTVIHFRWVGFGINSICWNNFVFLQGQMEQLCSQGCFWCCVHDWLVFPTWYSKRDHVSAECSVVDTPASYFNGKVAQSSSSYLVTRFCIWISSWSLGFVFEFLPGIFIGKAFLWWAVSLILTTFLVTAEKMNGGGYNFLFSTELSPHHYHQKKRRKRIHLPLCLRISSVLPPVWNTTTLIHWQMTSTFIYWNTIWLVEVWWYSKYCMKLLPLGVDPLI